VDNAEKTIHARNPRGWSTLSALQSVWATNTIGISLLARHPTETEHPFAEYEYTNTIMRILALP